MNKYAVGLLCCCVYVAGYTQVIPSATLRRSVVQSLDVAVRSQQVNLQAQRALLRLFEPSLMESQVFSEHPEPFQRAVFQVQKSPMSHSTASAFAVEFEDEWWGVTAAHVINNIQADPYMRVKNHYGKELFFPIEQWHSANRNGSDVAVFKIPYEAKPFIQVLPVAKTPAKAGTASHILSFVKRGPLFAQEEVLFSGPYRLLLRDETHREMTGFCGSPVLVDGKVVGLNVGFYTQHDLQLVSWNQLLRNMSPD